MSARLRAIASETVAIVERDGHVPLGTRLYLPEEPVATPDLTLAPSIEVTGESTLEAAARLAAGDGDLAVLNFASAKNPGGGFLRGAQAQEESLARSSALYASLTQAPGFYSFHRAQRDLLYSDRVIYSPGVLVFRDDKGGFLPGYRVAFLTSAAPNAAMIRRNQPEALPAIPAALARRAGRVLDIAAAHGHQRLLLGAWGCGVFGNDPATVAGAFAAELGRRPWFGQVTFAVLDRQPGQPVLSAFIAAFGK
ncbi:TIGR02452 family protein [Longispora albida]|uniref:TIGR02452 family protein n=1 Tax=Longispora albida TaxID=203523 RepID=UPI00036D0454|nr:TIGR02452 family protein [Longispora albida]